MTRRIVVSRLTLEGVDPAGAGAMRRAVERALGELRSEPVGVTSATRVETSASGQEPAAIGKAVVRAVRTGGP